MSSLGRGLAGDRTNAVAKRAMSSIVARWIILHPVASPQEVGCGVAMGSSTREARIPAACGDMAREA
ncbi:MAG: hypothetical protein QM784_11095 [Polyangiaceae bacterium]